MTMTLTATSFRIPQVDEWDVCLSSLWAFSISSVHPQSLRISLNLAISPTSTNLLLGSCAQGRVPL